MPYGSVFLYENIKIGLSIIASVRKYRQLLPAVTMSRRQCKRKVNQKASDGKTAECDGDVISESIKDIKSNFEFKAKKTRMTVSNKRTTEDIKDAIVKEEIVSTGTKIHTRGRKKIVKEENINGDIVHPDDIKLENDDSVSNEDSPPKNKRGRPAKAKRPHVKLEYDSEEEKPIKLNVKTETESDWRPKNWETVLSNIREMRSAGDAPVDSMGCDQCWDISAPPNVMRYQTLIALMLSSQTKDEITYAAMERLKEHGLNIDNILNTTDEVLGKLIYPVGFWRSKVKYIKLTSQRLKDNYNSDIPGSVEELCKLVGVGPKMAHICMSVAWNQVTGIGVDTHVHRISNRIGWLPKETKTPEATRKLLQSWLPCNLWSEVNHLLVGFGQTICKPVKPQCNSCLNKNICPFVKKQPKKRGN